MDTPDRFCHILQKGDKFCWLEVTSFQFFVWNLQTLGATLSVINLFLLGAFFPIRTGHHLDEKGGKYLDVWVISLGLVSILLNTEMNSKGPDQPMYLHSFKSGLSLLAKAYYNPAFTVNVLKFNTLKFQIKWHNYASSVDLYQTALHCLPFH